MAFKKSNPSIGGCYGGARPIQSSIKAKGKPGTMRSSKRKGAKSYGKYA